MKKLVILGLDGTIADTSPGILYCINHTVIPMGYKPVERDSLYGVIGISLEDGFKSLYSMEEDEIEYAANNYSKLYSLKGKNMLLVYEGIVASLEKLKADGYKLALATQKHKMFTSDMLNAHEELKALFDAVCATDVDVELTKSDMLLQLCQTLDVEVEDALLVGDSEVEAMAAEKIGMDFAAVLYGWGFKTIEEAKKYDCKAFIETATDIYKKISKI